MSTVLPLSTTHNHKRVRSRAFILLGLAFCAAWLAVAASHLAPWIAFLVSGTLCVAAAGWMVAFRRPDTARADAQARAVVARAVVMHAVNPIAAHALGDDKAFFADSGRTGGVAYRVCAGVALAAGEPLGAPEHRLALASAFMAHCRAHGWIPAFYQVLDQDMDAYHTAGLRALKIGEEAMIDLPSFTLVGKHIANVRHCVTHCERAGLRVEVYEDGVEDDPTLDGLELVSAAWLDAQAGRGEMGFSMGSFNRDALRSTCVALARDGEGRVCGFVTFHRVGAGDAACLVLDLMRRDELSPSGTIDFVIARALEHFRDAGYRSASLSLAPLAGVALDSRYPRAERLLSLLYEKGNGVYRYKSLYNFKRKFAPHWAPRYLLYPGGAWNLIRVGLAVALVHLPRTSRRPGARAIVTSIGDALRQTLNWRRGLEPGHLRFNLRLMTILTFIFAMPELYSALGMLGRQHIALGYSLLALALAVGDASGAVALARRLDLGRRLLAAAAAGFLVKTMWGLVAGYDAGLLAWGEALVLAPVEVWVIWFLLQPEVRAHVRNQPSSVNAPARH